MTNVNSVDGIRKICHVTSVHNRYDVRIFHKECKSLANSGYDVTLLVNDNLPGETIDKVRIVSSQFKPRNRFERMIKSKRIIKQKMIDIDADVYHFHDPELLPEAAWIKKNGKKVVFDFHEDVAQQILFKYWIPSAVRSIVSALYKSYEKRVIVNFDGIITVTPKFVERLLDVNSNTVMVTNYPIYSKSENMDISNIDKKRSICFAGGISPQWNHESIIKAIESIENVEYLLAGSCSPEYLQNLQELAGWSKVRYLGRIPHEEVKDIYRESSIGMTLLSYDTQVGNEGTLGNTKIFEFMAAGLPVICSNNKLWRKIINDYECGIAVDPTNINSIKDAIEFLMQNPTNAKNMGKNGTKAVIKEYNWYTQEKVLLSLYEKIM